MRFRLVASFVAILALAAFSSGCQKLRARDNLNKGVQAFKATKFSDAAEYFKAAINADPSFTTARLYLATAYMSQYTPGSTDPDNEKHAQAALEQFQDVLKDEPKNDLATASIASLYFNQKNWDEAEKWNKKVIENDPNSVAAKDAYYTLGVIAWTRFLTPDREARSKLNMKPDEPGPIKDKKIREELKAQYMPMLDQGIEYVKKALQIDPEYNEAMAYMNLLIRYRADLLDTPEEYKQQAEIANNWVKKSLETMKIKAERKNNAAAGTAK